MLCGYLRIFYAITRHLPLSFPIQILRMSIHPIGRQRCCTLLNAETSKWIKQTSDYALSKQDNRPLNEPTTFRAPPIPCVDRRRLPMFYACKRAVINSALRRGRALYCNFPANAVSALEIRPGRDISLRFSLSLSLSFSPPLPLHVSSTLTRTRRWYE